MKARDLRQAVLLFFPLLLASQGASAETVAGSSALALASLVAAHSPLLSGYEKRVMARLFTGHSDVNFPASGKISVKADAVVCRASNVDITSRSRSLSTFSHSRSIHCRSSLAPLLSLLAARK